LLNLWGGKESHVLQQFLINLTLYIKNTTILHEKRLEMEISIREGRISGFRECRSDPHIWPPEAPLLEVDKFQKFI
jgi:hypothetical protein